MKKSLAGLIIGLTTLHGAYAFDCNLKIMTQEEVMQNVSDLQTFNGLDRRTRRARIRLINREISDINRQLRGINRQLRPRNIRRNELTQEQVEALQQEKREFLSDRRELQRRRTDLNRFRRTVRNNEAEIVQMEACISTLQERDNHNQLAATIGSSVNNAKDSEEILTNAHNLFLTYQTDLERLNELVTNADVNTSASAIEDLADTLAADLSSFENHYANIEEVNTQYQEAIVVYSGAPEEFRTEGSLDSAVNYYSEIARFIEESSEAITNARIIAEDIRKQQENQITELTAQREAEAQAAIEQRNAEIAAREVALTPELQSLASRAAAPLCMEGTNGYDNIKLTQDRVEVGFLILEDITVPAGEATIAIGNATDYVSCALILNYPTPQAAIMRAGTDGSHSHLMTRLSEATLNNGSATLMFDLVNGEGNIVKGVQCSLRGPVVDTLESNPVTTEDGVINRLNLRNSMIAMNAIFNDAFTADANAMSSFARHEACQNTDEEVIDLLATITPASDVTADEDAAAQADEARVGESAEVADGNTDENTAANPE